MILEKFIKQPDERKDYDVDYQPWLREMTTVGGTSDIDQLTKVTGTVVCTSNPTDTSLVLDAVAFTATRAKFWLLGGTAGNKYKLTINATTVGRRIDQSELVFTVKEY